MLTRIDADPVVRRAMHVAQLPDVDNHPFCWRDPASCSQADALKGAEDVVRSGDGTTFSYGDVFTWGSDGNADAE